MLIAKTNQFNTNTFTLDTGTSTDSVSDLRNSNFSYNFSSSSNPYIIDCGTLTSGRYVAVLGIGRASKTNVTVSLATGTKTNVVQSIVLKPQYQNAVFKFDSDTTATIFIKIESTATTTLSCIMGGEVAEVPNNGVVGGQIFPALQNNKRTSNTLDQNASPTNHITRKTDPTVTLSFPNILRSWLESEIFDIYDLHNEFGLVPMLEFNDANNYSQDRCWLAYGLQPTKTTLHSQTNELVNISLPFKASV